MNKQKLIGLLTDILMLDRKLGSMRVFIVGLVFPEYRDILGKLADISREVESSR